MGLTTSRGHDPSSDRLMCVRQTGERTVLEQWAWKAVDAFIRQELGDREGNERLVYRELLLKTVIPHGPVTNRQISPKKTAGWLTFPARDGEVEVSFTNHDGGPKVTIKATGYPSEGSLNGAVKTFDLR